MSRHLDANMVLRYLLNDVKDQALRAKEFIDSGECCLSNEVLAEVVYVLARVYELSRPVIIEAIAGVLPLVECEDHRLLQVALEIFRDNRKLDIVDAILAARYHTRGDEILTFDKDLIKALRPQ